MVTLDLGNLLVHLKADASQYNSMMKTVEKRMMTTARKMSQIGRQMSLRVTAPIVGMAAASIKAFASFDDAMTKSLSIMGDVSVTMRKDMEDLAISLSTKGVTSATDLAKSYYYLASAGLTAEQSMSSLSTVASFSIAGAFDTARATDLLTDAQTGLRMSSKDTGVHLKNLIKIADQLTFAARQSNDTVEGFAQMLTSDAATASVNFGMELETTMAILSGYASQGKKAGEAGNLFGRALRLLSKASRDNANVWEHYNIPVIDEATGEYNNFIDIIAGLEDAFKGMTKPQRDAALAALGFRALAQKSITPLLGLSDAMKEYEKNQRKAAGTMQRMVDKQLKSFSAQMIILWNNVKSLGIEIGEILAPYVEKLSNVLRKAIDWIKDLDDSTKKWLVGILLVAAAIGPLLISLGFFIKLIAFSTTGIIALGVGIGKVIIVVASFAKALAVFTMAHPILAMVALLTARLIQLGVEFKKTNAHFGKLAGIINDATRSLIEHGEAWDRISVKLGETSQGRIIAAQAEEMRRILKQKLEQLKFLREDYKKLGSWDKWIQAPARESVINRLELEIATFQRRIDSLTKQGIGEVEGEGSLVGNIFPPIPEVEKKANQIKAILDKLAPGLTKGIEDWSNSANDMFLHTGEIAGRALNGVSSAITTMVMRGKADFKQLALSIIADVVQMIVKMLIARALMATLGLSFAPVGAAGAGAAGGAMGGASAGLGSATPIQAGLGFSKGGIVPQPVYAVAGFVPKGTDTVPAMLTPGELVLSRSDVSSLRKGSERKEEAQQNPVNVKVVNVLDKSQMIDALSTSEGENVIINAIKRNKGVISGVLR